MAFTLPIGIRLAAGLLGATIDRIGKLPQELPTLGLSLAGQAVRTSFRIRQEVAELATRGDELLAGITGRPQEKPAWATFDEDEDPSGGQGTGRSAATAPAATSPTTPSPPTTSPAAAATGTPVTVPVPTNRIRPGRATPAVGASASPGAVRPAATPRVPTATPRVPTATPRVPTAARRPTATPRVPTATPRVPTATRRPTATPKARSVIADPTSAAAGSPVTVAVTGDHRLSIAELKDELQTMQIAAVRELLELEETGRNRAAYLTLLSNRLTTLAHQNGQSESR